MQRIITLISLALLLTTPLAHARKSMIDFPIADVMQMPEARTELAGVTFYFGDQAYPATKQKYGTYKTNKKTNAFLKSDHEACNWVMLSALIQLRDRALAEGGNAVVNVMSNYDNNPTSSTTTYLCAAGNVIAGVALKGQVVRLK